MKNLVDLPLEQPLLEEIAAHAQEISVFKGASIVKEGDAMNHIPFLMKGSIRVFHKDYEKDREMTLYYIKEKEACMFSYFTIFSDHKSKVFAVAELDSSLLLIPREIMNSWQFKYPSWQKFVVKTYIHNYEILLDKLKEASLTKIEGRLKAFFKNKCSILNTNEIPITHQVIANEFGTTRVVISRVLKKMEQEKVIILGRGKIILI